MPVPNPLPASLERLEALTRDYSRYSQSAGGLAAILGGLTCLASYLVGGVLPASPVVQCALIGMPLLWLLAKHMLARHYYQRFGRVTELITSADVLRHRLFVGFTGVVCMIVAACFIAERQPIGERAWELASVGYLAVVMVLPLATFHSLRTPLDFVIGVFLLCQAAMAMIVQSYPLLSVAALFPVVALVLIAVGIRDHQRFTALAAELRRLMQAAQASE
ncbi:MAG: hypothetical protein ACT4NL_18395 [Pseudomarimonas sp.]